LIFLYFSTIYLSGAIILHLCGDYLAYSGESMGGWIGFLLLKIEDFWREVARWEIIGV
jgi:hypothetical protein